MLDFHLTLKKRTKLNIYLLAIWTRQSLLFSLFALKMGAGYEFGVSSLTTVGKENMVAESTSNGSLTQTERKCALRRFLRVLCSSNRFKNLQVSNFKIVVRSISKFLAINLALQLSLKFRSHWNEGPIRDGGGGGNKIHELMFESEKLSWLSGRLRSCHLEILSSSWRDGAKYLGEKDLANPSRC